MPINISDLSIYINRGKDMLEKKQLITKYTIETDENIILLSLIHEDHTNSLSTGLNKIIRNTDKMNLSNTGPTGDINTIKNNMHEILLCIELCNTNILLYK